MQFSPSVSPSQPGPPRFPPPPPSFCTVNYPTFPPLIPQRLNDPQLFPPFLARQGLSAQIDRFLGISFFKARQRFFFLLTSLSSYSSLALGQGPDGSLARPSSTPPSPFVEEMSLFGYDPPLKFQLSKLASPFFRITGHPPRFPPAS